MKRYLFTLAASAVLMSSALAQTIGVTMAQFDDRFLTNLRQAMQAEADKVGVNIQFEDAQADIGRQLSQIQNFIAQGVDAIIVSLVDTASSPQITKLVSKAGIPLVYVNRKPFEEELPEGVYYVGSDENVSGKLLGEEIARLLNNKGKIAIMMGILGDATTQLRTEGVEKVAAEHPELEIVEKQPAKFQRNEAMNLMNNWLVSGIEIDAVAANNDEMAIGAIMALKQAGKNMDEIVIGGVDATSDALAEMAKGNLDVTVFQDAKAQGAGAVDTALKVVKGEKVENFVWIPFQLVTPENYKEYLNK